ncbi:MAG TPA: ATP-binding protein [Candidatus Binataceae bacterium]|nr:ATP-binding protein [Candidatus Binataceae bacterium]
MCFVIPFGVGSVVMRKSSSLPTGLWQEIVDSLSDAVVVFDPALVPIAMNPAAETLFGVSHLNQAALDTLLHHNEWLLRMVETCLTSGQELADAEARLSLGSRLAAVSAEVAPLLAAGGTSRGVVVLLHDLALHRGAAQALSTAEPDLRLSPAGLAHEVKNPLTGIKGAAELLAGRLRSDPRAQQYCGLILEGVNRIAALVEQVLAASSPQRLSFAPVNIHRVLHQALRMAGLHPHPPNGLAVEQLFDPSLPEISADAAALERTFLNLVRNAAEAIGTAGTIRLRTRMETEFRLGAEGRRMQFLRVEVSDSGRGMNAAEMAQLFTPFYTTKPSGTGLGLVLSQRIVAAHGGKLWAEAGGVSSARAAPAIHAAEPQHAPTGAGPLEQRVRGMTFKMTLPVGPRDPEPSEAA